MARGRGQGLKIGVDTSDLVKFTKRWEQSQKMTPDIIAVGLNEIGDGMISLMARTLAKDTGLALEQVRGLFRVERASRNRLQYEVAVSKKLLAGDTEGLEGGRESKDFGKRRPGTLVVVVSQKDELVCMDCTELEAQGPMPVEIAKAHLPVHPNCRCVIMPYVQKRRRLPVTMTSLSGTSSQRREGRNVATLMEEDMTLRQLTQSILDRTANRIRIEVT